MFGGSLIFYGEEMEDILPNQKWKLKKLNCLYATIPLVFFKHRHIQNYIHTYKKTLNFSSLSKRKIVKQYFYFTVNF